MRTHIFVILGIDLSIQSCILTNLSKWDVDNPTTRKTGGVITGVVHTLQTTGSSIVYSLISTSGIAHVREYTARCRGRTRQGTVPFVRIIATIVVSVTKPSPGDAGVARTSKFVRVAVSYRTRNNFLTKFLYSIISLVPLYICLLYATVQFYALAKERSVKISYK